MTVPRCGLGLVSLEGAIYAIGGWVGLEIGDTIEKYDPGTGSWSKLDKVHTPRFAFGITSYQGKVCWRKYLSFPRTLNSSVVCMQF